MKRRRLCDKEHGLLIELKDQLSELKDVFSPCLKFKVWKQRLARRLATALPSLLKRNEYLCKVSAGEERTLGCHDAGFWDLVGHGWTRREAVLSLTASELHVLFDRVKGGEAEVEDEPVRIVLPARRRTSWPQYCSGWC